jgi:hypothetical protein
MLELFIVPSVPHVRLRNGFSCLGHPIWQRLLLPLFRFVVDVLLLPLWVVGLFLNEYLAIVDTFSSECFVADVSMVFPMANALPPSSLWAIL